MRDPDFNDKDVSAMTISVGDNSVRYEKEDRGMYAVGILVAASVCSIFWFAVGCGLGWYFAQ